MINRLQFIHHNDVFSGNTTEEARSSAIDFLTNQYFKQVTRPSLYAEPLIVRYENKEKPNEPNIIMAIGSKGSGSSLPTKESEYFIIDTEGIKDDVKDKYEKIEAELAKLAFSVIDSNTLHLSKTDTDKGAVVSGDVKVPETVIIAKEELNNIILTDTNGIYSYVSLKFDDATNTFTFQVNEKVEKFSLPVIEDAKYDLTKESLVFTYTNGKELVVDLDDLIGEWTVEGEASKTPIVLTRERIDDKKADLTHDEDKWHDILRADVRIDDSKAHNILQKTTDGRKLYVDGTAENIYYKEGKNVREAIDEIKTEVSTADTNNIIYKNYSNEGNYSGLAADVDLKYNKETNILTFYYSDINGSINQKEFKLNSAAFIDDISYDTIKHYVTIRYKDEDGKVQKTEIDLTSLLDDWVVNSEAHNVKLAKQKNIGNKDVLSADVKIKAKTSDNYQILEDRAHELYVKGTADNIVYDTEKEETVKSALDRTENELNAETSRALSAETSLSGEVDTIKATIGSGFTTSKTETITDKFTVLSGKVDTEISERNESDNRFTNSINSLTESAETANANITNLYNGLGDDYTGNNDSHTAENTVTNRLHRLEVSASTADANIKELSSTTSNLTSSAETANTKISELTNSASTLFEKADALDDKIDAVSGSAHFEVGDTSTTTMEKETDTPQHTVRTHVKVAANKANNLIVIDDNGNGLYVTVRYDKDTNELIVSDNSSDTHERRISLNTVKVVDSVEYDDTTEEVVIKFNANETSQNEIRVPLAKLIAEWDVKNDNHTVTLALSEHAVAGKDHLSADVNVPNTDNYVDNAIKKVDFLDDRKGLYVSETQINVSAKTIADESSQKALTDANTYTDTVHTQITQEIATETTRATEAEKALGKKIEDSLTEAKKHSDDNDKIIQNKLDAEVARAKEAEKTLDGKITQTLTDAKAYSDTKAQNVQDNLNAEANTRRDADDALRASITTEVTRATSAETSLSTRITELSNSLTSSTSNLSDSLTAETAARTAADNTLQSHIDTEAQNRSNEDSKLNTAISNETTARGNADNAIRTDFEAADTALDNKITAETAARTADTKSLSEKISKEITDRTNADSTTLQSAKDYSDSKDATLKTELQTYADEHIGKASLNGGTTNTAKVTIKDKLVTADVIVSAMEGNIIKKSEDVAKGGIYATPASLTYQSATNSLTFTDENGKQQQIQLNSASFINSIGKSEDGKTIIISYSDTSGGTHTVNISLQGLIDALDYDNTEKTISLSLRKEDRNGISTNVLSAEANIANNTDEILNLLTTTKKDGKGELLVNGKPIYDAIEKVSGNTDSLSGLIKTIINSVGLNNDGSKKGAGDNIQKELDDTQRGAGLADDGQYIVNHNAKYISTATSLSDADNILDSRLYDLSSFTLNLSATTANQGKDLQEELDAAEIGVFGVNTDKTFRYAPIANSNYLNGATSLIGADDLLDKAIKKVSGDVTNVYDTNKGISADVKSLQAEIDRIETGSGLDEQGNYIKSDKPFISEATNLADADKKLADAISNTQNSLDNLLKGSQTYTVNLSATTNVDYGIKVLEANARLSLAKDQDAQTLVRTKIPETQNYEDNLLQIVKAKSDQGNTIDLKDSVNGLYFGGSIDYGMLAGDDDILKQGN